jgi:hypothetical protein
VTVATAVFSAFLMAASASPSAAAAAEAGWEMGEAPLSTPWTGQVSPDNALPEYPRPQLTRTKWENLNGVWLFDRALSDEEVARLASAGE